jgi:hypothetical protein
MMKMVVVIQAVVKVIAKRQMNIIMALQLFIRTEVISETMRNTLSMFEIKCRLA